MIKSNSLQKVNDFYLGVGLRSSKLYSNVAIFMGPSISYGSKFHEVDPLSGDDLFIGFTSPGIYANFDYTYKLSYDLGTGVSLYNSFSKDYHVYGFQFHLYFSGGFRRNV